MPIEIESQYAHDANRVPVRQWPLSHNLVTNTQQVRGNGTFIAVGGDVKLSHFLTLTVLLSTLSAQADLRLEVDRETRSLAVAVDGSTLDTFPVAVGTDDYPTPKGTFTIRKVIFNPAWAPPDSKWAKGKGPKPPGHPDNPMKKVKMFFKEPDYYIHGTDADHSLGKAESHGCLRMSTEDVTKLAKVVMEHGGKPMPEPWYRRIFRSRATKVVYLTTPVPIEIR
jgi:murein L,D-transpeptidase YcbB/YkuD